MRKHLITLTAALLVSAVAPTLYAQANRVAVVDLTRAVAETEDGRRALKRLERWTKQQQGELDEATERVNHLKQTFDTQQKVWTPEHRAEKAAELQEQVGGLQARYAELQRELARRQSRATAPILERMQRILAEMGRGSEGYAVIVDRTQAGVVWVPSNLDLTDDLIQRYNAGGGRTERPARRRGHRGHSKTPTP